MTTTSVKGIQCLVQILVTIKTLDWMTLSSLKGLQDIIQILVVVRTMNLMIWSLVKGVQDVILILVRSNVVMNLELDQRSARQHEDSVSKSRKGAPRAKWSHQMKLFLIQQLKDFNVPRYRTQNAWSKEAWNKIVDNINQKFGLSLDVVKVKQKEQDLKKDFRAVKDLVINCCLCYPDCYCCLSWKLMEGVLLWFAGHKLKMRYMCILKMRCVYFDFQTR